jgi:ribonuclease P/MRP protein subunit RPP40
VIYTDFSKAFDKLNHNILLSKLSAFGFSPSLLSLLKSYMSDRVLYVEYMGFSSFRFTVNSGIPQGSNLGPLLFLLFINDINEIFTIDSFLYADDLKLYSRIHNMHDCIELQSNVDLLSDCCSRNKLLLNKDKCITVSYSRKHDICRFDYKIDNHTLSVV